MEYHIFFVNGTITLSLRQIMIIVFLQGNIMGLLATGIRNYAISANQFNSSSRANNQENTKVNNKLNTQGNNIKSNIHKIREVLIKFFSNFKDFKIWKSSSDAQQFISNIDTETSNSNVQNHLNPIIIETLPSDDVVRALVKIKASIPLMKYLLEQPFSNVVGIKILIHAEDGDELYITRSKTGVDLLMETAEQSSASSTYFGAEKSNILDSFIDNDIKNEKLVAFCDFGILQYATQHKGDYNSQVQNEMATRDMVGSLYETYKAATKEATANSSNLSLNRDALFYAVAICSIAVEQQSFFENIDYKSLANTLTDIASKKLMLADVLKIGKTQQAISQIKSAIDMFQLSAQVFSKLADKCDDAKQKAEYKKSEADMLASSAAALVKLADEEISKTKKNTHLTNAIEEFTNSSKIFLELADECDDANQKLEYQKKAVDITTCCANCFLELENNTADNMHLTPKIGQ